MTNVEILNEILDDHNGRSEYYDFEDSDYLDVDEAEEWTQNHKYQYRQVVYWSTKHNVHVAVNETRSGSYHSDWYYSEPEVSLVEKRQREVTKTITEWITL
ncbi:hypothetical protein [Kosakonia phage Kc304]|uniref:Nucleotide reductase subunit C n=2 Tax=Winklervirus chi14 TaxID=2560752 RepID=A0A1Z1LY94_9CAUD|nr:ribonucleotide reductase [Serratia phage CHI14]ARW57498.1 hypothetical protein [Serratia phage CHI14]ARW57773.1 hypothetical protein [Serratia phage CBH8]QYN80519.1 hypothetical protein [Kosakonia phage Kc304]UYM28725.1 hypothetical protein [Serratia phage vB_SspM_LC53]